MLRLQGQSQIMTNDEKLSGLRDGARVYVDGKLIAGQAQEPFEVKGNVQPMNSRDLLLVPEGDRFKEQYWIFTPSQIIVNDTILREGARFQVQSVEDWGSYRKARIMRVDVGNTISP